jgi:hypothetical protein
MRKSAQDLVEQGADGGLAEHLGLLLVACGDDEILQGGALQVVHDHVDRLVLAEEVHHADHRRVRDLRQRAAFLEEALESQAVERELFRRHLRRQVALRPRGERGREVFLDGDLLAFGVQREVHHAESTSSHFADNAIAADHGIGWQRSGFDL